MSNPMLTEILADFTARFAPAPRQQQRKNLQAVGEQVNPAPQRQVAPVPVSVKRSGDTHVIAEAGMGATSTGGSTPPRLTLTPSQVMRLLELGLGRGLEEDYAGSQRRDACGQEGTPAVSEDGSSPRPAPSAQEQARAEQAMAVLAAYCRGEDVFQRERRVMRPAQPWVYVAHPVWDFFDYEYKSEPRKS